jgi:hypothetical protein
MRKFHTQFTEKNLTGNAGLTLIGRFAEKLGVAKILESNISIERGASADYQIKDVGMMLMIAVIAGAKHICHLSVIRTDNVLRTLFRWDKFPDDTTVSRIFKLFTHRHCQELSEIETEIRKKVWGKKWFGRVTLDMDSSVKGVFGNQEGAQKGYNTKKKGQKSYHPLFCFLAETRECLHNWFRTGSAYSANGCAEFMKECFEKLPKRVWKVIVRADSAFFDGKLFTFLEGKGAQYLVKVRMRGLKSLLENQIWRKVKNQPDFEQTEFMYKCSGWNKERRFVAVRKVNEYETKDELFEDSITVVEYDYFCYVSNMKLSPRASHKFYGKRATSENWIEWCKGQMAASSILTDSFWANSAIFQLCILTYNLMVWMMRLNDENGFREEPGTIRRFLIHVPARLRHSGRQWFLRLSEDYFFKDRWIWIENSILGLDFF